MKFEYKILYKYTDDSDEFKHLTYTVTEQEKENVLKTYKNALGSKFTFIAVKL